METNQPDEEFCTHCSNCGAATGCGARLEKPKHTLTRILAETLIMAAKITAARDENHYTLKDLEKAGASYSARNNHQKLRYFGLITHVRDENDKPIRGHWLITSRGGAFLRGEEAVHKWIRTFRNKIDERSEETVEIRSVLKGSDYLQVYEDFVRDSTTATPTDKARAVAQRSGLPHPVSPVTAPEEIELHSYLVESITKHSPNFGKQFEIKMSRPVFGKPLTIEHDGRRFEMAPVAFNKQYKIIERRA